MVLEESLYDPLMEEHERGKGAWIRRSSFTTTLGKRRREDENAIIPGRKLRRSASSKFDSQNDGFWTVIVYGPSPKVKLKLEKDKEPIKVDKGIETGHVSNAKNPFDSIEEKKPRGLFAGKRFYLHGFDEKKVRHPIFGMTSMLTIIVFNLRKASFFARSRSCIPRGPIKSAIS